MLNFFKKNMSDTIYENILKDYLPELKRIGKNEVLILMDNHPVHKSLNSLKFYKEKGIKVIDFPPHSLDLNPIENIWSKIKKQIMKKEYQTMAVLIKDIGKEWDSITDNQLKNYSLSMKDRIHSYLLLERIKSKY